MLTSRCGRGLALLCSAHPHGPRAPCVGRHREGLPLPAVSRGDPVGDDCRDNESDESDHDPGADGDNKRKRAKLPGSADDYDDQEEPAQGDNQPKRVKVATNNVSNQVVEWVRVIILRTSPSNCSYVLHAHHVTHTYTHNAHTLTHTHTHACVRTHTIPKITRLAVAEFVVFYMHHQRRHQRHQHRSC